jgi:hypothetical protein
MSDIKQLPTHVFEASGLGRPPFKILDYRLSDCRDTPCAHCGTLIKNIFKVVSSDDIISLIGSTCVRKSSDKGLINQQKRCFASQRQEKIQAAKLANTTS